MYFFSTEYALLAVQCALLDAVAPELRAVTIEITLNKEDLKDTEGRVFRLYFYYDGPASAELIDLWECAVTEASADLGVDFTLDSGIERLDYPQRIPLRGCYAYLRKEAGLIVDPRMRPQVKIEERSIAYGLLAVQDALLGVVTRELRSVVVDFDESAQLLYVRFYYDGKISEELLSLWQEALVRAHHTFGSDCLFDGQIVRSDYPEESPFRGRYAYFRKEVRVFLE